LIVASSKWRQPDLAYHDTCKHSKNVAFFSTRTGLFTYFSLQPGDPAWRGKNALDFGGSIAPFCETRIQPLRKFRDMNFTGPTTEQRRSFDEGGFLVAPNALPAETAAYFSAITGLFTYFSLQLGDALWGGKNVLDFGGSIGAILRDADSTIDEERYWCLDVNREALERGKADYPKAHWVFYNRYCFGFNPSGIPNLSIPDLHQTFDYIN
jgi:hypothetical protein